MVSHAAEQTTAQERQAIALEEPNDLSWIQSFIFELLNMLSPELFIATH